MTNIIADVGEVINISESILTELGKVLGSINPNDLDAFLGAVNNGSSSGSSYILGEVGKGLKLFDLDMGRLIVQPLLEGTMGINYDTLTTDSSGAVATLEGAVGFSLVLDGVVSALDMMLKPILGDRAPEFILDSIRKIPQSVGMEYFLGITLANTFESAVGTPLTEAINIQVLPARLDLNTIKAALKQHKMTVTEADTYRQKLGFPLADWNTFLEIGTSVLAIGDIQLAYEYGFMSENEITTYLEAQGFSDSDIVLMEQIYLHNSETSGGQVYRSVARTAYLQNAITSAQFTTILEAANVPQNSITMELAALDLQKSIGLRQLAAGDLKTGLENGDLTQAEVTQRLIDMGYDDSDVTLILTEWGVLQSVLKPTVSAKTIIRYLRSGVITDAQATDQLLKLGVRSQDISTMIAAGGPLGSGYAHTLSEATVIAAYKDGVISVDDANNMLVELGTDPTDATLLLQIANYQVTTKTKKATGTKGLTEANIFEAYKEGIAKDTWVINELKALGYSDYNCQILLLTENAKLGIAQATGWVPLV